MTNKTQKEEVSSKKILAVSRVKNCLYDSGDIEVFTVEEDSVPSYLKPIIVVASFYSVTSGNGNRSYIGFGRQGSGNKYDVNKTLYLQVEDSAFPIRSILKIDALLELVRTRVLKFMSEDNSSYIFDHDKHAEVTLVPDDKDDGIYIRVKQRLSPNTFDLFAFRIGQCKKIQIKFDTSTRNINFYHSLKTLEKSLGDFGVFGCTKATIDFILSDVISDYENRCAVISS